MLASLIVISPRLLVGRPYVSFGFSPSSSFLLSDTELFNYYEREKNTPFVLLVWLFFLSYD